MAKSDIHCFSVLVTGADGQLGSEIRRIHSAFHPVDFFLTDINELDITDFNAIQLFCGKQPPDLIINCAAYTNVDKAEAESEQAERINAKAVKNLADAALKYNSRLIHISTDYVFNGTANIPYKETDPTSPNSVYGKTKVQGEQIILDSNAEAIVIRTSWLYSFYRNNFVKTILRLGSERKELKVVFDQTGTPTYALDLAKTVLEICRRTHLDEKSFVPGIYHYSNEGVCSWYDFAREIIDISGIDCKVLPVETSEYPTPATRPVYSVLNKSKIKSTFGITIPHWKESLRDCIERLSQKEINR